MENITDITPKQKELLDFIKYTENLHKHLRLVFNYAVQSSCQEGIPADICNNLSMVSQLADTIEEVVTE
ncbi:MAG: hypothetical protein M1445_14870 [Bacteroidetes bacterium]|nr:hypothetical protein [Bacteroidota bacterium]MCL6102773.1 hypothetical protein [Bacteroidota bacterium]